MKQGADLLTAPTGASGRIRERIMAAKQYKIKVELHDNPDNPSDLIAKVVEDGAPLNVREICEAAIERGRISEIGAQEMAVVVNAFLRETACQLCSGLTVQTCLFSASPKIKGNFNSPNAKFTHVNHHLIFYFNSGAMLREEAKNVYVDVTGMADVPAAVVQVTDVKTGSVNDLITPRHALKINGNRIRIAGENSQNGIYFIHETSGAKTKISETDLISNNPSELIVIMPELPSGKYKIELITQYTPSSKHTLKEPRATTFDKELTVVET